MKCPKCIKEETKSIVTQGYTTSFPQYTPNRWDEEGKLIIEESIKCETITLYYCSNDHNWTEKS